MSKQKCEKLSIVDIKEYAESVTLDKKETVKLNPKLYGDESSNASKRAYFKKFTWDINKMFIALSDIFTEYSYENFAQFVANTERDVRALLLVANQGIAASPIPNVYSCASLSRPKTHNTTLESCDCEDFQYRHVICYHILALRFLNNQQMLPE